MQTRHGIGLLAGLVLLLASQGGLGRPASAQAVTCGTEWSVAPSPNAGSAFDELRGVSAASASDAWAVGSSVDAATFVSRTLTEHWDGSAWTLVPSPNRANQGNVLRATAAVSGSDVWAVGASFTQVNVSKTLTQRWDGSVWKIVPSANAGRPINGGLFGVAAVSARDAWAVGSYDTGPADLTLVEHWNGSRWAVVPSPNVESADNRLFAVDAVGPNDVWAVGSAGDEVAELERTLVEHWDGSAWTVVPSPNLGPGNNRLTAVAAVAANDVWAVGVAGIGTLVVHWDGATWSVVASPNPSSSANLAGVAAVSASDVWAVGGYFDETARVLRTLVEHWDGSAWSVVASPNVPPSDNRLNAMTALPARQWAVGSYFASEVGPVQTLIEQRCA
jgi:hypothetical protein